MCISAGITDQQLRVLWVCFLGNFGNQLNSTDCKYVWTVTERSEFKVLRLQISFLGKQNSILVASVYLYGL